MNQCQLHITMSLLQQFAKYQHSCTKDELIHNLVHGKNCVLLGFPGSGKTVMTADIVKTLIQKENKNVAVTGSTGSAAQQIKSLLPDMDLKVQTVHSFFGFRQKESSLIDKGDMVGFEKNLKQQIRQSWRHSMFEKLRECDVLIVDEISMLTSEFISAMDTTSRIVRSKYTTKFGGLTLCLIGDFRQLPPVNSSLHTYLFQHPKWDSGEWIDKVYSLEYILRQDLDYSERILRLSVNRLTQEDKETFQTQVIPNGKNKIMDIHFLPEALRVFHTNREVNMYNDMVTSRAIEQGYHHLTLPVKWEIPKGVDKKAVVMQLQGDKVHSEKIFIGSNVIITANLAVAEGIVNGTTGRVTNIENKRTCSPNLYGGTELSQFVTVELDDGRLVKIGCHSITKDVDNGRNKDTASKVWYIPLLLSHAITVHRLQGSTIKRPLFYMPRQVDKMFCREFYVIATRVTSIDLLHLTHLPYNLDNAMDPVVIDFYHKLFQNKAY